MVEADVPPEDVELVCGVEAAVHAPEHHGVDVVVHQDPGVVLNGPLGLPPTLSQPPRLPRFHTRSGHLLNFFLFSLL